MITVLLEQIIQLLKGWIESFNNHAEAVEESLTDLNNTASDIELNTDPIPEIRDNTGAIITPITQIKTNTDSIKTDLTQIKTDTGIIKNNANSISTSSGAAAAFAEDCATNTLDIVDKVTTIASDTTQLRADSANITADVSSINQALGYYIANTPVTEDSEGAICNFDTDMEDYLQKAICTIPADGSGFSSILVSQAGINLFDEVLELGKYDNSGAKATSNNQLRSANYIPIKENISLYVYIPYSSNVAGFAVSNYYDVNKTFLSKQNITSNGYQITTPANACYMTFFISANYGTTYNNDICFNYPDTERTYSSYTGNTFNISLGSTITDGAEVDLLSGIVKINTTPVTYSSITPIAIRTYKGVNNIYSDVGSMSLTYRETLKHYLDKQQ